MCSASATNGDFPFIIRLRLEYVISIIGTASTKNGSNTARAAPFITPAIDSVASRNPENRAPESPINIFAGLKLYVRNANIEPARIKAISAVIGWAGLTATAIMTRPLRNWSVPLIMMRPTVMRFSFWATRTAETGTAGTLRRYITRWLICSRIRIMPEGRKAHSVSWRADDARARPAAA